MGDDPDAIAVEIDAAIEEIQREHRLMHVVVVYHGIA
jgi:hypothetical protein